MGRKKKFIDKKKSATFQLLARDSFEPKDYEGPSGNRVLVRVDNNPIPVNIFDDEVADNISDNYVHNYNSVYADAPGDEDDQEFLNSKEPEQAGLPDHVLKEILELGFPDDGYNYLIHLRELKNTGGYTDFSRNSKSKLHQLPLDVKAYDASSVQITELNDNPKEKLLYNIAAKSVDVGVQKASDPEVAALLDDSDLSRFGSDIDELEEDFVIQANIPEENKNTSGDALFCAEKNKQNDFISNHKTVLDSNRTPDSVKYSLPEIEGCYELLDSPLEHSKNTFASDIAKDYETLAFRLKNVLKGDDAMDPSDLDQNSKAPPEVIRRCVEYANKYECEGDDQNVDIIAEESSDESEEWDCETIVSTYSNLDNHPGKIEAPGMTKKADALAALNASKSSPLIVLKGKQNLPVDFLRGSRKDASVKEKGDGSIKSLPQKRLGHESAEEKKERKAGVKEERREARRLKKEMKCLFKSEAQRAQALAATSCPSSIRL